MSSQEDIQISVEMKFSPNDFDVVHRSIETFVKDAKEDKGILGYAYYVNDEKSAVVVREHYANQASMIAHLGAMDQGAIADLFAVVELGPMTFAGPKSDELVEALAGFGTVQWFEPLVKI